MDNEAYIVILSAAAAAVSFASFAMLFLNRKEKQERYREVIEQQRRTLFERAREQAERRGKTSGEKSAAGDMAALYKLQKLGGEMSANARTLMLQAGNRNPNAPLVYLVLQALLPLLFTGLAVLVFTVSDREIARGTRGLILIGGALFGFFLPRIIVKNTADKRKAEISLAFPDALDMLLICVQGGIGIEAAINRIAGTMAEHSEALAEELGILSAELGMLNDRKAAFQGFAQRVGSGPARSFANAMLQAEQYGTSISKAVRVLSEESRETRMSLAEQKAASLPPKLTVPMIGFFLPPLFVIILGPAFLSIPK